MIANPIDFRHRGWNPGEYAGQDLFFIVDGMIEYARCFEKSYAVCCLWAVQPRFKWFSCGGDVSLSREDFFSTMMEKYPDHLEWLLFHPEWLL